MAKCLIKVKTLIIILTVLISAALLYSYFDLNKNLQSLPRLQIGIPEARARRFGLIIDVRTPKEREVLGFYPDSIPISVDQLSQQVPMDISSKNTHILVYSNGDDRTAIAANILYKMGYRNVRYIMETYLSLMPGSQ